MWTNYKHVCNTVVGQCFKASSDVIIVTIGIGQLDTKRTSEFQFLLIISKTKSVTYLFYCFV